MKWADVLKSEIEATYGATLGLFSLAEGENLDWKPTSGDNWMTLGQLLMHCTNACGFCCKGFATGDWGPMPADMTDMKPEEMLPPAETMPTVASVAEAKQLLDEDKKTALGSIQEAGDERLENERSTPPWGGPERSLGQHMLNMIEHLGVHKAQLFYYLKLLGKPVNTHTLWGMG